MSKKSFPRKLLVVREEDTEEPYLIPFETPDDVSEDFAGQDIAVYELATVGKFTVEKHVNAQPLKLTKLTSNDLDNMRHNDMINLVQRLRLKLYTKGMSTKALRGHLREYLERSQLRQVK
jgi:hypothetical protein